MGTIKAFNEILGPHFDYIILAHSILLYLTVFVAVDLLVLSGELSCTITKGQTAFSTLTLHAIHILLNELLLGLTLVVVSSHTNYDIAVPAIFVHFSSIALLLSKLLTIARLEIVIPIMSELNIHWLPTLYSHCIKRFLFVVSLCFRNILFGLFGESELEVCAFEV